MAKNHKTIRFSPSPLGARAAARGSTDWEPVKLYIARTSDGGRRVMVRPTNPPRLIRGDK